MEEPPTGDPLASWPAPPSFWTRSRARTQVAGTSVARTVLKLEPKRCQVASGKQRGRECPFHIYLYLISLSAVELFKWREDALHVLIALSSQVWQEARGTRQEASGKGGAKTRHTEATAQMPHTQIHGWAQAKRKKLLHTLRGRKKRRRRSPAWHGRAFHSNNITRMCHTTPSRNEVIIMFLRMPRHQSALYQSPAKKSKLSAPLLTL